MSPIRIELYDSTLRDGAQTEGVTFSLNDKLVATSRLDELGIDYVEGNSGYIVSINDVDEFAHGKKSGWMGKPAFSRRKFALSE